MMLRQRRESKSSADAAPSKAEGGERDAGSPSGYDSGKGQKPVSPTSRGHQKAREVHASEFQFRVDCSIYIVGLVCGRHWLCTVLSC